VDKHFRAVKDFLYKNPNMTIKEVAEQTGTDERIILHFLKEGRLEMSEACDFLRCEVCGIPIKTGRVCSKCAGGLSAVLDSAVQQRARKNNTEQDKDGNDPSSYSRMHTKAYIEKSNRR
jgi:hypothetical protein